MHIGEDDVVADVLKALNAVAANTARIYDESFNPFTEKHACTTHKNPSRLGKA